MEGEQSKTGGRDVAAVMSRAEPAMPESLFSLKKRRQGVEGGFRLFSSKVFFPTVKNNRK